MNKIIYDFAAVGVGPFNLGLACLTHPIPDLNGIFLDKRKTFNWHPGMLLQDTTLQVPFLADHVTLADPTSPFSFLNYMKEQGRIYAFYIRENFKLLRNEYNQYCQWTINRLPNVHFNTSVERIEFDASQEVYLLDCVTPAGREVIKARKLVLGTGTTPYIPSCCKPYADKVVHSADYLTRKQYLQSCQSITIVGSGQSAAEIFYDLLQDIDTHQYGLHWITRSPRFYPLEYSKLTLEMTSPEYVDYFYSLPQHKRDHLIHHQKHLYKGINNDLIAAIFDTIYAKKLVCNPDISLRTNADLRQVKYNDNGGKFQLQFFQAEQEQHYQHTTEGLIMATGYTYKIPDFLEPVKDRIQFDDKGRYLVNRNYTIDSDGNSIFVQNAELHTHGFVTPDLGMGCYRNAWIIREMLGREVYPIEKRIAFQQFAVSPEEAFIPANPQLI